MSIKESVLQKAACKYLNQYEKLGKLFWFHPPNGGRRDRLTAINLKNEGVKAGVPDCVICFPEKTVFVELKTKKGSMSVGQKEVCKKLQALGYDYYLIKAEGIDDLKGQLAVILDYYLSK